MFIHLCSAISPIESRCFGLTTRMSLMRLCAALERFFLSSSEKPHLPFVMRSYTASRVLWGNGEFPVIIQKSMHPIAQTSILGWAGACVVMTSGARYLIDPASVKSMFTSDWRPDMPKSTTFTLSCSWGRGEVSAFTDCLKTFFTLSSNMMFSSLRSLWIMFSLWQYYTAENSWEKIFYASFSPSTFFSLM